MMRTHELKTYEYESFYVNKNVTFSSSSRMKLKNEIKFLSLLNCRTFFCCSLKTSKIS